MGNHKSDRGGGTLSVQFGEGLCRGEGAGEGECVLSE
jgi:hypothetical protein